MCTLESHDHAKRTAWHTLTPIGVLLPATKTGAVVALANCPHCSSTLAKTIRRAWTEDEYAVRSVRL